MFEDIRTLIASGKTKKALEEALRKLTDIKSDNVHHIYLLLNQFNKISKGEILGLGARESEVNRIVNALLEIIKNEEGSQEKIKINKINHSSIELNRKYKILIFLFTLILISVFLAFLNAKTKHSNAALYEKYSTSITPSIFISRSHLRNSEPNFRGICDSFMEGRFRISKDSCRKIIVTFRDKKDNSSSLEETNEIIANATYALASNELFLENFENAKANFQYYLNYTKIRSTQIDLSEWGLILCKLITDDLDEDFILLLNDIALNKIHIFNKQAIELRISLKSKWRFFINEKVI